MTLKISNLKWINRREESHQNIHIADLYAELSSAHIFTHMTRLV